MSTDPQHKRTEAALRRYLELGFKKRLCAYHAEHPFAETSAECRCDPEVKKARTTAIHAIHIIGE